MPSLLIRHADLYLGGGDWLRGAVLVRDGRIEAIGPDDEVSPLADPDTEVRDAVGASVIPGLHDTHVHPPVAGAALLGIDLSPVHDADEYHRLITEYADAHPDEAVLTGSGWYGDLYPGGFPTRSQLDTIVPDRPAMLLSHDGHGYWVNSAALDAAGITDDAVDPPDGRLVRDDAGRVTGVLLDGAMALLAPIRPVPSDSFAAESILAAQRRLHSLGITTWHDAAVGETEFGTDVFDTYLDLASTGSLTARVVLCLWWDRRRGLDQLADLEARRARVAPLKNLTANTVKVMQDGVIENVTGALIDPYSTDPGRRGESFIAPGVLNETVTALDARGFQVHLHAVGDRAVRECLDATEAARDANGSTEGRHQIAHLDLVDPADVPRFADLDVTANAQMLWARADQEIVERKLPLIGEQRAHHHFPFGSLHAAGARVVGGSDWPVTDPNPFWAMHTGMHRLAPATDPHATGSALTEPLLPEQGLPFSVVLDAYTGEAAWAGHLDQITGRIAVGLAADLAILDRDIASGEGLDAVRVLETFIDGRSVYRA